MTRSQRDSLRPGIIYLVFQQITLQQVTIVISETSTPNINSITETVDPLVAVELAAQRSALED